MTNATIERYKKYAKYAYYRRSRRPFSSYKSGKWGRWQSFPNTRQLRPGTSDRIYGGRDTFSIDIAQGIFGYFFGGGWVFGHVENARFRATSASISRYLSLSLQDTSFEAEYWAGDRSGQLLGVINLDQGGTIPGQVPDGGYYLVKQTISVGFPGSDMPRPDLLSPIDRLAATHDNDLRVRDEKVYTGVYSTDSHQYDVDTSAANAKLRDGLLDIDWDVFHQDLDASWSTEMSFAEYQKAKSSLAYEEAIGRFSSWILGFADEPEAPDFIKNVEDIGQYIPVPGEEIGGKGFVWPISFSDLSQDDPLAPIFSSLSSEIENNRGLEPGQIRQMIDDRIDFLRDEQKRGNLEASLNSIPAEIGSLFGSILGSTLAGGSGELGDSFKSVLFSSVGAQLGRYIGAAVDTEQADLFLALDIGVEETIRAFPTTLGASAVSAASGYVSTMLTDELIAAIGIRGEAATLIGSYAGTILDHVITGQAATLLDSLGSDYTSRIAQNLQPPEDFDLQTAAWAAVTSYIGTRLADDIIPAENTFSAVSSSVFASSAAKWVLSASWGNPIVATVAAFATAVVSRFFGNLFGSQKPRIPTADAETVLNFASGYYQVGQVTSKNGGNEALVRDMSEAARDTLNGLIGLITHGSDVAGNANLVSPTQVYGHTAGDLWVKLGGASSTKRTFQRADQAVDYGALWAIRQTKIAGGDLHLKRALQNSSASSVVALSGDLQIAEDYAFYLQNQEVINAAIAEPYDSLSSADKAFYNANAHLDSGATQNSNESRITRIMAAPRDSNGNILNDGSALALNTADQNWYNANKATVDRIVEGLHVTQFAAGWIVTLQRAAELGLNKTSRSDFYGGLAGFADSLKLLANTDFEYEDMRLSLIGDTLRIGHAEFENLLENPSAGGARKRLVGELPQGWSFWTNDSNGGYSYGVNAISGTGWHADLPEGTLVVQQQDAEQGKVYDLISDFDAEGGKAYTASAYTGAHRSSTQIFIQWRGANGEVAYSASTGSHNYNHSEAHGGDSLSGYKPIEITGVAPSWAVTGRLVLRKHGTQSGQVDSWLFATRPHVEEVAYASNLLDRPAAGGAQTSLVGQLPQGWSFWTNDPDGGYSYGVNAISGPEWHANLREGTVVVHQQDGQQGYVQDLNADFEATGGKVYTASVYTGAHRADIELLILWFGANGEAEWAYENSPDRKNRREAYGGDHLSGYKLIKTTNTAPDWAVSGRLVLRKRSTAVGEADSWMFATRPQVTEGTTVAPWSLTATEFSVPESWDVEDFFASGGYSKMVGGKPKASGKAARALRDRARDAGHTITHSSLSVTANTGLDSSDGNDFYQHASAHAVSVDDLRTETVRMTYEYSFYHNPYEPDIGHGSLSTTVSVEGGDDIFIGNVGNDTLRGRSGFDWLDGGGGEDVIYGGDDDDVILGGDGTDRLYGENGDDYIHPGDGHNYYKNVNGIWTAFGAWGGHGNDTIVASGTRAYIDAQGDDDTVILTQSIIAWSRYNGGAGIDTLSFERYSTAINLNIGALVDRGGGTGWRTFNSHEHFIGFENFTATEFNDTLTGDTGSNLLRGLAGDDVLSGHTGNDTLEGGAGADTLNGDAGTDAASYENSDFAVWVDLSNGESFGGDAEGDTFVSVEHLHGSDYDDTLKGDAQGNMLTGGKGDDWFVATHGGDIYAGGEDFDTVDYSDYTRAVTVNLGYTFGYPILSPIASQSTHRFAGIEHIVGSDFNDTIYGTALDNVFQGGKGNDILRGGAGLDTYIFHSGDGQDKISETLNNDGGWDTLMFGDGITWSSLNFAIVSNVAPVLGESNSSSRGDFRISVRGTSDKVEIYDNWLGSPNSNNGKLLAKIDTIDVGGVGGVDIRQIGGMALGTDNADHLYGDYRWNRHDMIFGYGGNDTIYAAGADRVDHHDNVMSGGRGNDTLYASNGDDTYIFERGDGIDTIIDSGGVDRIQFGPSIAADEVIFEIVGTDLYIGLRDPDDGSKRASQVSDRMRITSISRSTKDTKIEHITAGGVDIALAELDLWAIDLLALPPTAVDDHAATAYGTPIIISAFMNDRADANGQSFSYVSHTDASHGSISHLGFNVFRYVPNQGFSGTDQFTYTIQDEGGQRDTATVTITTAPAPPAPPRANNDLRNTLYQTAIETNVFGNDQRDVYNQAFRYHSHTGASRGSVDHLGNGVFRYTPNNGFSGLDSFTYTIEDEGGERDTATVSVITALPPTAPPRANNDNITTAYQTAIETNAFANDQRDAYGQAFAYLGHTPASNGSVSHLGNGVFRYTPNSGFFGSDSFNYTIRDVGGELDTATVTVTTQMPQGPNTAPVAVYDFRLFGSAVTATTINVTANDWDADGDLLRVDRIDGQPVTAGSRITLKSGNEVVLSGNGTISYFGTQSGWGDSFTYRVTDGRNGYASATVDISAISLSGILLPIVLDLDGDGADLVSVMRSRVVFENDGGGPLWRAGWVAPEDGFLALDRDGDGVINRLSEISFLNDYEGATTDLEGLRGFDSNQDGVFDRLDDQWSAFLVWQDVNQNGIGTGSELMSLEEAGIVSISLALTDLGNDLNGNRESTLLNEAAFTFADQRVHKAYDVALNIQLAHIQGTSNADLTQVFEGSEWRSDGAFGVAYNAQPGGPDWDENATAPLQTIDGGRLGVDDSIPLQTLWRYVDADDSMAPVPQSRPDANTDAPPSYGVKPLVIDMDGDGLELINPYHSPIEIDGDGDGAYDRIGWVSSDDAFLALDRNGDQMISAPSEILFDQDLPGAQTVVEGLRAYDSNGDAWLDASDARFGEFMVWQDRNSDGLSTSDELRSLSDVGIRRIALTRQDDTFSSDGPLGNTVFGQAALIWEDGRTGMIGDVELRALSGNLEEQRLTEQMRLERQRVGLGAWDFDRDARRAALDDLRAQDFNVTDQTRSLTSPGREISPFADGERMTGSADDRDRFSVFEGRARQTFIPSANGAVAAFDAADLASKELSPHTPSGGIRPETGDRQEHRRHWWSEPHPQPNPTEHGAASLSQLLAGFDAARDRFNAATPTLPVESAETLAERQRFLQAVASFRGSSGIATPRRMSDRAYAHDAMIGASSIVRNGAHNMTVA